ncbi:Asx homology domain-containing protein [Hypoxylon crocopeplum]|nr:Asx homology domain-containing protein [Hypoxylon crocopeplum]
MPPRKKSSAATANKPTEAVRRSTRASKKAAPTDSSSDELSSENLALRGNTTKLTKVESPRQEEPAEEITVRTTRAKSYTSSRPSTANSDTVSQSQQSRIVSTSVTKGDMKMLDVGDGNVEDELAGEGPALKKSKPMAKETSTSTRKGRSKYDNPEEMLTNPRAPLATVRLRDLLCSAKAWDLLSAEEKQQVLAKFPESGEVLDAGTEDARPDVAALRNNDNFRHDVARYQEDLSKGWHDPEWILQAQAAHRKREIGAYDEYLAARFEEDWNVPMPGREEDQDADEVAWGDREGMDEDMKGPEQEATAQEIGEDRLPDAMQGLEGSAQENRAEHRDEKRPGKENDFRDDEREEHPPDTTMTEGDGP